MDYSGINIYPNISLGDMEDIFDIENEVILEGGSKLYTSGECGDLASKFSLGIPINNSNKHIDKSIDSDGSDKSDGIDDIDSIDFDESDESDGIDGDLNDIDFDESDESDEDLNDIDFDESDGIDDIDFDESDESSELDGIDDIDFDESDDIDSVEFDESDESDEDLNDIDFDESDGIDDIDLDESDDIDSVEFDESDGDLTDIELGEIGFRGLGESDTSSNSNDHTENPKTTNSSVEQIKPIKVSIDVNDKNICNEGNSLEKPNNISSESNQDRLSRLRAEIEMLELEEKLIAKRKKIEQYKKEEMHRKNKLNALIAEKRRRETSKKTEGKQEIAVDVKISHKTVYNSLDIDSLYKEVREFLSKHNVERQIIDIKILEDEFGKENIKKLILKSYLISIGKGVTVGK